MMEMCSKDQFSAVIVQTIRDTSGGAYLQSDKMIHLPGTQLGPGTWREGLIYNLYDWTGYMCGWRQGNGWGVDGLGWAGLGDFLTDAAGPISWRRVVTGAGRDGGLLRDTAAPAATTPPPHTTQLRNTPKWMRSSPLKYCRWHGFGGLAPCPELL